MSYTWETPVPAFPAGWYQTRWVRLRVGAEGFLCAEYTILTGMTEYGKSAPRAQWGYRVELIHPEFRRDVGIWLGPWMPDFTEPFREDRLGEGRSRKLHLPLCLSFVSTLIPTGLLWYFARRRSPGHCRRCGYDLTGNESGRCPECGAEAPVERHKVPAG
jgi:hypothetical protein